MIARNVAGFLMLVVAFALATWLAWWVVPAVALLWGWLRPGVGKPALLAGLAAAGAWGLWLAVDGVNGQGALGVLQHRLAGVMNLPPVALPVLTLVFPFLLAWSAAALAGGLAGSLAPSAKAPR